MAAIGKPFAADARALLRKQMGVRAEQLACNHLCRLGFELVARNVRVGRLEIDIIARRGRLVIFCEVRSRASDRVMTPAQSIDVHKVRRVRQAAAQWLRANQASRGEVRFDVASVLFDTPEGRLNYLEGAF